MRREQTNLVSKRKSAASENEFEGTLLDFQRESTASEGHYSPHVISLQIGTGHGASARGSFWTTNSSVIPPKKRRESMTENPFCWNIFRKRCRSGKRSRLSAM
jgi:hypothetical protein